MLIPFSSYHDRLSKLSLKTLEYRRLVFDLIYLFKIIQGLSDLRFSDYFIQRKVPYTLGGSNLKIDTIVKFKTTKFQHCFFNRLPPVWNALPNEITAETNLNSFKRKLNGFNLETIFKFTA